jgi:hypothetical protein
LNIATHHLFVDFIYIYIIGTIVAPTSPSDLINKGTKGTKGSPHRRHLKISSVESEPDEFETRKEPKERRASRSSRRERVHPESRERPRSKAMEGGEKRRNKKANLIVNTGQEDERQASSAVPKSTANRRGSRDLRSPGEPKSPVAEAAKLPSEGQALPDFITQTDANGNASTPRSASAIQGASKAHPSGPKPRLHVGKRGQLTEDEDDDRDNGLGDDPCDTLLDSLRMMCCCFMEDSKSGGKCLSGQSTQDTDENRPRLLGSIHPEDTGKPCLVLDLDETLVHSSFRAVPGADFVIPVQVCDGEGAMFFCFFHNLVALIFCVCCCSD